MLLEQFLKNYGRLFHGVALSLTLTLSRWERAGVREKMIGNHWLPLVLNRSK